MSAAEKLKALDDGRPGYIFAKRMKAALPQIVAVVKAAEYVRDGRALLEADDAHLENALDQNETALVALDKALSPPTGGSP